MMKLVMVLGKPGKDTDPVWYDLVGTPFLRLDILPGNAVLSNATASQDFDKSFRGSRLIGFLPDSEDRFLPRNEYV